MLFGRRRPGTTRTLSTEGDTLTIAARLGDSDMEAAYGSFLTRAGLSLEVLAKVEDRCPWRGVGVETSVMVEQSGRL